MQNIQDSHETGQAVDSCSEGSQGSQGQGSHNSGEQTMQGNSSNMEHDSFANSGQNIYQGSPQNSMNHPQPDQQAYSPGQAGEAGTAGGEAVNQNAYNIPHYASEGYVSGRPQEANNPQTAGNIQGSARMPQQGDFQGTSFSQYQQAPPQMQTPQWFYNQPPPNVQPLNSSQQYPEQRVFQQNPYNSQYVPPGMYNQPLPPPLEQPGAQEKRHGQVMDVVTDIINGERPDIPKLLGLFENIDTQFWKGAITGAVLVLIANNDTVKKTIGDFLSGITGKSSGTDNEKGINK